MTRLGSQKVRTGCKTCKIRKVKCDETWPQCLKCKKAGRPCDGYTAPPAGSLPWGVLLRAQPSVSPAANNSELRGLAFFHQAVAPVLSGPFDASFWTHLVAQTTHHDDGARHAVLAISTLFEHFAPMSPTRTPDNPLAIRHYNRAIQQLVKSPAHDVDTFLTVCILFICIEFLRGDGKAAINHTQHGLRILSATPGNSKLTAVFSHINLFPLFFGTKPEDFSVLTRQAPKPVGPFQSMVEAQHCLDIYIARALHLIMQSEGWKTGRTPHDTPTPAMMSERGKIVRAFEQWELTFAKFQARRSIDTNADPASLGLKIRALTLRIWTLNCLTREEIVYDVLKPDFERIVDMATRLCAVGTQQSRFMFDTGSSPLLHFIALKCRFLRLRVAALAALKTLACPRESLWDSVLVYSVAKRVAEVEHGVEIGPDTLELIDNGTIKERVPPEEERVRVYRLEDEPENPPDDGKATYRRGVFFLMVANDGTTTRRHEWITLPKRLTFQALSQKIKKAQ